MKVSPKKEKVVGIYFGIYFPFYVVVEMFFLYYSHNI